MEELDALLAQVDSRDSLIIWLFCKLGLQPGELFALAGTISMAAASE